MASRAAFAMHAGGGESRFHDSASAFELENFEKTRHAKTPSEQEFWSGLAETITDYQTARTRSFLKKSAFQEKDSASGSLVSSTSTISPSPAVDGEGNPMSKEDQEAIEKLKNILNKKKTPTLSAKTPVTKAQESEDVSLPTLPGSETTWGKMKRKTMNLGVFSNMFGRAKIDPAQEAQRKADEEALRASVMVNDNFIEKARLKAEAARQRHKQKMRSIINPKSKNKILWDIFIGGFIIYSVCVVPWRISFDQFPDLYSFGFWFDMLIDFLFIFDMAACFCTGYHDERERFIWDHKVIALNYLKTWFFPDLLSTLPFDRIIPPLLSTDDLRGGDLRSIKLIRIVRLFRLIKIARLLKGKKNTTELTDYISPSLIKLLKLLFKIVFVAHLLACFWFYVNQCAPLDFERSEYINFEGEKVNGTIVLESGNSWEECGHDSLASQYCASIYWTIATMMAVGYGEISGDTGPERLYAIFTQLVGAIAFGFIIATVTLIVETMDPGATANRMKRDELRDFMTEKNFTKELQKKAKRHYNYLQSNTTAFRESEIVMELSHTLKEVIIFETRHEVIDDLKFFTRASMSDQFIADCLRRLKPMMMQYREELGGLGDFAEEVYFCKKGKIEALQCIDLDKPRGDLIISNQLGALASEDDHILNPGAHMDVIRNDPSNFVIVAQYSDGYEFELGNCLMERPMNLLYRASKVTDLFWLDHADLIRLTLNYPTSSAALHERVRLHDEEMAKIFEMENIEVDQRRNGLVTVKEKIFVNDRIVSHSDAKGEFASHKGRATILGVKVIDPNRMLRKTANATKAMALAVKESGNSLLTSDRSTIQLSNSKYLAQEQALLLVRTLNYDVETKSMVEAEESIKDLWSQRRLIYPEHTYKMRWDVLISMMIIFSVVSVPVRLGFDLSNDDAIWVYSDWGIDAFFLLDIAINFRTCYFDDRHVLVTSLKYISENYVKTWFIVDILSTIPIDKILSSEGGDGVNASNTRSLKLIRVIRLVRLFKLVKLLKQQQSQETEELISINPIVLKIAKLLITLVFIAHFFGCFFAFLTLKDDGDYDNEDYDSWWKADGESFDLTNNKGKIYLSAIYWAFTTMTTVGYGDILPRTDSERVYATLIMILGATVFGYIVGSVGSIASNPHGVTAKERERQSMFNNYMEEQNLKPALRKLVKEQMAFNGEHNSVFDEVRIIKSFPINVRREMIMQSYAKVIDKIILFENDISLITNVMIYMKSSYYSAGQYILRNRDEGVSALMFLLDGIAEEVEDREVLKPLAKRREAKQGKNATRGEDLDKLKNRLNLSKDESFSKLYHKEDSQNKKSDDGLKRHIIESGKCFGYEAFVTSDTGEKMFSTVAYRAFSNCSIMQLGELELRTIIEKHPVLREKLFLALKNSIIKQTAKEEVLEAQVKKLNKKNNLFSALQGGITQGVREGTLKNIAKKLHAEDDGGGGAGNHGGGGADERGEKISVKEQEASVIGGRVDTIAEEKVDELSTAEVKCVKDSNKTEEEEEAADDFWKEADDL